MGDLDIDGVTAAWTSSSSRPTLMPPTAAGAFDAMLAGMQVPEPSSMLMLGLAGMALLGSGTRRRTLPRIWMNSTNFLQKWAVVTAMALVVTGLVRTANAVGLLGYWSLDDNLLDQSPFGNNGTLVNNTGDNSGSTTGGPEFDSDVPAAIGSGKSMRFDGLDDAVNLGNNHGTQTMGISGAYNVTTNDWTISGWIKTNINGPWVIFANGSNGIANPNDPNLPGGIRTNLWQEGTNSTFARLTVDEDDVVGMRHDLTSGSGSVVTGTWYHVAAVRRGLSIELYLNGSW